MKEVSERGTLTIQGHDCNADKMNQCDSTNALQRISKKGKKEGGGVAKRRKKKVTPIFWATPNGKRGMGKQVGTRQPAT